LDNIEQPSLEPNFSFLGSNADAIVDSNSTSTYIQCQKIGESGHWIKAFGRSFADFLPLLSLGGDIN
jgi:hypothetical protein